MTALTQAAVAQLAEYRLRRNLSYRQLSDEMKKAGWYVPPRSLHLVLTGRTTPVDRTQFRIEQFVVQLRVYEPPAPKQPAA